MQIARNPNTSSEQKGISIFSLVSYRFALLSSHFSVVYLFGGAWKTPDFTTSSFLQCIELVDHKVRHVSGVSFAIF